MGILLRGSVWQNRRTAAGRLRAAKTSVAPPNTAATIAYLDEIFILFTGERFRRVLIAPRVCM